jgi:hypothetical protein
MNKSLKYTAPALALLGLTLGSCQPELDANPPVADAGPLNFASYVAVGNSLTAGYADGGLYNAGQEASYPNILAKQFAKTGKGPSAFVQPLFDATKSDGSGYLHFEDFTQPPAPGTPAPVLLAPGQTVTVQGPTALRPTATGLVMISNSKTYHLAVTGQTLPGGNQLAAYTGTQPDNLGVPGISVLSSLSALTGGLAPYGAINPFYERLLTATERPTKDYVTYIGQKTSTFFTCWMGNNDVLTYATAGGVSSATNPFSGLTDTTRFGVGYRAIVGTMSRGGTIKGACANIPNVTALPYFTTVRVADIIAKFKLSNPALSLYITTGTGTVREATPTDLLVLTSSSVIGTTTAGNPFPVGAGLSATACNPLSSQYVLDATEAAAVQSRTTQLNNIIAKTARQNKVAMADMNAFFVNIAGSGFATNAVNNTTAFLAGNLFSLDGVHPTPRGYAVVANEWIRTINAFYGSKVPLVNPGEYQAVLFP